MLLSQCLNLRYVNSHSVTTHGCIHTGGEYSSIIGCFVRKFKRQRLREFAVFNKRLGSRLNTELNSELLNTGVRCGGLVVDNDVNYVILNVVAQTALQ